MRDEVEELRKTNVLKLSCAKKDIRTLFNRETTYWTL